MRYMRIFSVACRSEGSSVCLLSLLFGTFAPVLTTIPPVLDHVVASVAELTCDGSPQSTLLPHHSLDNLTLFRSDGGEIQTRFEVLVPSLATLFSSSRLDKACDPDPVGLTMFSDELPKKIVLFRAPWPPSSGGVLRHGDEI